MKLFMQGMRRSGTTIMFDILSQDDRLDLYYEPFSQGNPGALGGGSGIQEVDLMEKIHRFRAEFIAKNGLSIDPTFFNYGAPRDPALEMDAELPDLCKQYLAAMAGVSEHTAFKFTRVYRKVSDLLDVAPDGCFVLLMRDPKHVVASYLYGRNQRRMKRLPDADAFFAATRKFDPWKAATFFDVIIKQENRPDLGDIPDFMRILYLWKYTAEHALRDGSQAFGDRFMIVRHEDLVEDPRNTVERVYDLVGLAPSSTAIDWAANEVRASEKRVYESDPRWDEAFDKLDMREILSASGY